MPVILRVKGLMFSIYQTMTGWHVKVSKLKISNFFLCRPFTMLEERSKEAQLSLMQ